MPTPEDHEQLVNKIYSMLGRTVQHDDPLIELRQKMALVWQQKIEALRHDFLRQRFKPTPKQRELMELGARFKRRAIFAGNRVGKTVAGCAELTYHLTGCYPDGWKGYVFTRPIKAWCSSVTKEMTMGGLQEMLMGRPDGIGTGFLPWARIADYDRVPNVPGAVNRVRVKWGPEGDRESILTFKSYEQGRKSFQTERVDFILLDEEPPYPIYQECKMRVLGTTYDPGGHILLTFTPLEGMTEVCLSFLEPHSEATEDGCEDIASQTTYITASWDDNPYLSKAEIEELVRTTPAHELEARRFGRPSLGAGKIYQIPESRIIVEPFPIPDHWHHGIGLDHGWDHPCAITTWARDPGTGCCYLLNTWKQSEAPIPDVASVLRQCKADRTPIFADPSGEAERQEAGGRSIFDQYAEEGIFLVAADNQVNAGLEEFRQAMMSGQLKVFGYEGGLGPNQAFFDEFRLYRRDNKGKVVKVRDDALDSARYAFRHRDEWQPWVKKAAPNWSRDTGPSWRVS